MVMAASSSFNLLNLRFLSLNPNTNSCPPNSPSRLLNLTNRSFKAPPLSVVAKSHETGDCDSIVNPSLKHANILFFNSAYNVQIVVEDGEAEEALLRRFKREVSKAGVIQECKRRRFFENKHEEKKRKAREASRRNRRRRSGPRYPTTEGDASPKQVRDDKDDNWDMPAGDIPN
eukprot:TRINITY_DN1111_c0_g2_i1.p1 TRINITY_DN1111_c0_g2~~TRINITY_DN1111_c0_g2_i1.p1  ORF type:complete len:174 (-),score=36.63 TRINITY_DN1111_c0_g2_i1:114-635(-)